MAAGCLPDYLSCFDLLQTDRADVAVGGQLFCWEHGHQVLEVFDVVVLVPSGDDRLGLRVVAAPSYPLAVDEDPHSDGDN